MSYLFDIIPPRRLFLLNFMHSVPNLHTPVRLQVDCLHCCLALGCLQLIRSTTLQHIVKPCN